MSADERPWPFAELLCDTQNMQKESPQLSKAGSATTCRQQPGADQQIAKCLSTDQFSCQVQMEKLWKECVHNKQHSNRTHRFQQNRGKSTVIVRNPTVKQMCIPKEYIINSELIKIYKCFKAFSKFFFKLFCYLAEGSQRHFKLDFLINSSHTY